jgi:DinB family protein
VNTECSRRARELVSTIDGEAWYGDSLRVLLENVTAEQALARPIPNAHSIWEIVAHVDAWVHFFSGAIRGIPIPPWPAMPEELDWPPVAAANEDSWQESLSSFFNDHLQFAESIQDFGDDRLESTVPGRSYNFNQMFQSASLHVVYHAGQIALLKKLVR